jgi:hypothetical protein
MDVVDENSAEIKNATIVNQVVKKIKLRHHAYIFVKWVKKSECIKITRNFIENYNLNAELLNPGLYLLISSKSEVADEKAPYMCK